MKNLKLKPFLSILLVVSGLFWFAFASLSGLDIKSLFNFMRPIPKVVTVDLILIGLFVKWVWRWKYLQGWLVPFPDLNGTWQGIIQTSWKDTDNISPGPISTILTIKQTFGHISCVMRTGEMESHSYVEGFSLDPEKQIRKLCYSYTSRPKTSVRDRSTPHDGTMLFNIIGKPVMKLEGEYWTQRKTTGTITLTFHAKDLFDELPVDFPVHPMTSKEMQ